MVPHPALTRRPGPRILSLSLLAAIGTAACGGIQTSDDVQSVGGDVRGPDAVPPSARAVPFDEFTDDVGTQATNESRTLIKTSRGYNDFFGHAPPAGVDFSKQWVIFYSAGTRPTGGFDANIVSLFVNGSDLVAVTELVSPGSECAVTDALTSPHVLIKFAAQAGTSIDFRKQDRVQHCGCTPPPSPCAAILCQTGTHCEEQTVECVAAPCPATDVRGVCVPNGSKVACGGIAGTPCPGGGKCVDDPSDSCDPAAGGADCGGVCQCIEVVSCPIGTTFDSSPTVCTCVPSTPPTCTAVCNNMYCQYGNVLDANGCPTCACAPPPDDPCATILCQVGTHCEKQDVVCVAAPCPPVAACVADPPRVACGGIAGIACPGLGKCFDDPKDSCDPKAGGADCGGFCQCVDNVACSPGTVFDNSPTVCACVPQKPTCGPVCSIACEYGNVLDANGCPTCACNPPPANACPPDKCPLPSPLAPTVVCADGTVGGPACVLKADGTCGWTIVNCPRL